MSDEKKQIVTKRIKKQTDGFFQRELSSVNIQIQIARVDAIIKKFEDGENDN